MNALLHQAKLQPNHQRKKIRNILVRYCGCQEVRGDCLQDKNYHHPENAFLVKYFPKYYQSLALQMKHQNSLLSKIKRIKKLKRCTSGFYGQFPQVKWFKILANNRKEMEELPQTLLSRNQHLFREKTSLHAVKFFFMVKKLNLPPYQLEFFRPENFLAVWRSFSKHLRNMRRLKILEIYILRYFANYMNRNNILNSLFQKLNGMPRLLKTLEVLKFPFRFDSSVEILQENLFSYVTNLVCLSSAVSIPPQVCKNLKSISLESSLVSPDLIIPIHELINLQSISINWSGSWSRDSWFHFIPPVSLKRLKFEFKAGDLIKMRLESENLLNYWKEIKELDAVNLKIHCEEEGYEMLFTKRFTTALLKKVSRLASYECEIDLRYEGMWRYEPFLIEEVSHLYEDLKRFSVKFRFSEDYVSFDFGFLKPFRNLKEINIKGYSDSCLWVNIADAVRLLEENTKDGEFSTLKIGEIRINSKEEFKKLLKKVSREKKSSTNFKILLALEFPLQAGDDELVYLDQFCKIIEAEPIKCLEISLNMRYQDDLDCDIGEVKGVLCKYPGLRNFLLQIHYNEETLEFIKRDGEIEQLLLYPDND